MTQVTIVANTGEAAGAIRKTGTYAAVTTATSGSSLITNEYISIGQTLVVTTYFNTFLTLKFDLSSIPAGSIITNATLMVKTQTATAPTEELSAAFSPLSNPIALDDYLTSVEFAALTPIGLISTSPVTVDTWYSFSASNNLKNGLIPGIENDIIVGVTEYGTETAPPFAEPGYQLYTSEASSSANRPKLELTYYNNPIFGMNF